ncbi:beta-lactamase family protein [Antarcticibacterium sp. 1MA-6-2]|uniref:serine hydrolase domain-containing protein n=1 Tax=Antarcticibacterium sp. 1MA-6-2 TaxID=2908210 RepID=UPI001F31D48E|nr:serine hydrolase [Antarcticibacterium sp. 1MA-6-2]UJH92183.1 beta-lactamase family protein [Antarcticibacterium sp. 1MA-6-2]
MVKYYKFLIAAFLLLVVFLGYINYPKLNIITGFAAKNACSCIFEAGRDLELVETTDNNFDPVSYATNKVNYQHKTVTSTIIGLKERKAVYNKGIGCILLPEEKTEEEISIPRPARQFHPKSLPYPYGNLDPVDSTFANINYIMLEQAINNAFDPNEEDIKRTRAVVVLYKGHLIAEKYGPGINSDTKLLGWSMTKSITSAILGILEKQGKISLYQDELFESWSKDERSAITLDNLLQMNSGLEWEEDYSTISDVTRMLFQEENMAGVQLSKPLTGIRGVTWNYSSGTTNLLSAFIRNQFKTHQEYLDFWYKELIDKISMHSMTLEPDLAGNYVCSSYSWATARDWAKFGLLYLNKGSWHGEQLFKESWVDYTTRPANGSKGKYGAHFWLNAGGKYPNIPTDLYSCNGFQGQHVFIIPSKDLVVVRFGLAEHPQFNVDTFLYEILETIE